MSKIKAEPITKRDTTRSLKNLVDNRFLKAQEVRKARAEQIRADENLKAYILQDPDLSREYLRVDHSKLANDFLIKVPIKAWREEN